MKIGVIFEDFSRETGGGHQFQLEILRSVARLEKGSHQLIPVLSTRSSDELAAELRKSRKEGIQYPVSWTVRAREHLARSSVILRRRISTELDRLARRNNFDLVWFVCPYPPEIPDTPFVATVWDLQHRLQPWFPEVSAAGEWLRREKHLSTLLRRATRVIVGTNAGADELSRFYGIPAERIWILPHPAPGRIPEVVRPPEKAPHRNFILYPAQFWPHKNHVNLLHALDLVRRDSQLDLDLVLVGSDRATRERIAILAKELNLEQNVRFEGFVERERLFSLYDRAFALTYVSYFGPENLPPLEAFAVGCPVIASRVPGAEEQLGDAALLVDPSSAEQIADAITTLWSKPELRRELIARGRRRAGAWTPGDFLDRMMRYLDDLERVVRAWR